MKKFRVIFLVLASIQFHLVVAQRTFDPMVKVIIGPDHTIGYINEARQPFLVVTVMEFGNPLKNVHPLLRGWTGKDETPKEDSLVLPKGYNRY